MGENKCHSLSRRICRKKECNENEYECPKYTDFDGWDDECVKEYQGLMESSLKVEQEKERGYHQRAGALLSLNGVVLALTGTFIVRIIEISNSIRFSLLAGISALLISMFFLICIMLPCMRMEIDPQSHKGSYTESMSDAKTLRKRILSEKICSKISLQQTNSWRLSMLSVSLVLTAISLSLIGVSLGLFIVSL